MTQSTLEPPRGPLIITAQLKDADQAWADRLRQAHYPAARNQVPPHITLFHHLPPSLHTELRTMLKGLVDRPAPSASLGEPFGSGGLVALAVESAGLLEMRAAIAERFARHLIPQDRALNRLHITVQNKVAPSVAKETLALLRTQHRPAPLGIAGLAVWVYEGGPWSPLSQHRFRR
ncbi:hypothetical protein M2341_002207 [Sphingobium sp. B7D2B]|uniref:2'-5' RNA ligase family protein n=1 Tax=Sphingobium sp. B7D2B TaxID=2940583 RepID=UPI0022250284|nr:2'-5' RNA ligase family protein [Sphingobium sp. B7D2B]MCW2366760.1 hypothetical protein [Sphingobium sp. B7D2B]